jgi:hypothetical protein
VAHAASPARAYSPLEVGPSPLWGRPDATAAAHPARKDLTPRLDSAPACGTLVSASTVAIGPELGAFTPALLAAQARSVHKSAVETVEKGPDGLEQMAPSCRYFGSRDTGIKREAATLSPTEARRFGLVPFRGRAVLSPPFLV